MTTTSIEWTAGPDGRPGRSWNPTTGCTKISDGCDNCYASSIATRFAGTPAFPRGFEVTLRPDRLDAPLRWRRPTRVFVDSASDLFHDEVPFEYIAQVFAVMARTPQHTYLLLTKRHGRMRSVLTSGLFRMGVAGRIYGAMGAAYPEDCLPWPLPNVHLGVSVEDQRWADVRIPALLAAPAAVRWISAEPLLGPVDLAGYLPRPADAPWYPIECRHGHDRCPMCDRTLAPADALGWVVAGGESGAGARPCDVAWIRSLRDQCQQAEVPVFVKQLGSVAGREHGDRGKGNHPDQWPEDLRVREYPQAVSTP